eukprot:comp7550_c0_seq2/m.3206 comp7550_c0_seq2/g.3206  ORF comp7550_c0_seq2/g.3206 comp7550_c0_seq2/m.3206 type:complete len:280 (-) comp7550_c0_seq2:79-918(-)
MLAKESVKQRLQTEEGMSFAEFSYQVFQSFDFYHLHKTHNCVLQLGGSDQWGNITAGIELIRRTGAGEGFGITVPLITTSSGVKFGKSMGNAVWLNAAKTSPYQLYQFFVQTSDTDAPRYLRQLTLLPLEEIEDVVARHQEAPEKRHAQQALARHMTLLVHGEEGVEQAERATAALFGGKVTELGKASDIMAALPDAPSVDLPSSLLSEGLSVLDLAVKSNAYASKAAARRAVEAGGLYINDRRVEKADIRLGESDALDGCVTVVRAGKKKYHLVRWTP